MKNVKHPHLYSVSTSSDQLAEVFFEAMDKGQISFTDWHALMTEPLDTSFSEDDEDSITRLIYAVRQGLVKVIDQV